MNTIYLMKDEKRNYALFKVGFTENLENRIYQYTSHNPEVECISTVNTYQVTHRNVEKLFHQEIEQRGYQFSTAIIDGKRTEWFRVAYTDPFFGELCSKGLNAFRCGKNRKDNGTYYL